jgi:pectin lyase
VIVFIALLLSNHSLYKTTSTMFATFIVFFVLTVCYIIQHAEAVGTASGFAKGTTGGGNAPAQIPANNDQLQKWLADSTPRVIVLDRTFDFTNAEGKVNEQGCRPSSNRCVNNGGQDAINGANWCKDQPSIPVSYYQAAIRGLQVASHKTLLGNGTRGILKGKGLRITNGASNIIIQNIHITDLNPQYIWGGDAITLAGSDMIWIDHCKFSLIGRQMIVTGYELAGRVTISNCEFDGRSSWSATCNGQHYWTMYFTGKSDSITLQSNYIHHTSGRGPKVGGYDEANVLLHAVNNFWQNIDGIALEDGIGGNVLLEGNYFENVKYPRKTDKPGVNQIFAPMSQSPACQTSLGRPCEANKVSAKTSSQLTGGETHFLVNFQNKNPVGATSADQARVNVLRNNGVGKIN